MKLFKHVILGILLIAAIVFAANEASKYFLTDKSTKVDYASTNIPEYKESEINRLKRELDDQRVKSLKLQAALDACKHSIYSEVKTKQVVFVPKKAKKSNKALDDCNRDYMKLKTEMEELIGAKSMMEVEKDLEINKLKRQMDTCAYFVQEMDKALVRQGDEITKLTNQKDSLTNVLQTPIGVTKEFPCLKAKKGTVVMASVIPATGEKDFTVSNFNLPKDKYKAAKKSCKKVQIH